MEQHISELTMLLIYLTGWEEDKRNAPGKKVFRAWKGYKYEIMDDLQSKGLIRQIPGGKSLTVTDEGIKRAKELKRKYLEEKIELTGEMGTGKKCKKQNPP